jgi:DNA ligase-1
MIHFAELYAELDRTTKTTEKQRAMCEYFANASPSDAAWAIYFLTGDRIRRLIPTKLIRVWAAEAAGIPDWLFEESYHSVGDLAETVSLIVPPGVQDETGTLTEWVEERLETLRGQSEETQQTAIRQIWEDTIPEVRFVVMKLLTGALRVGVSKRSVTKAIAKQFDLPVDVVAHRLMGSWTPTAASFESLIAPQKDEQEPIPSRPYPFCLAHALAEGPEGIGEVQDFCVEWKWDGIRGQVIRRSDETFVWSRGEEMMEGRWPEIELAARRLPNGTVLDGEILAMQGDQVLSFGQLQRRIARKKVGKKLLSEVPVVFQAFDMLEQAGEDIRDLPLSERRARLESLLSDFDSQGLRITQLLRRESWQEYAQVRNTSRQQNAEGLMLKAQDSKYDVGRVRGTWWKWKIEPYTIDAVMIYAQKGHGRRANLYTDYTFALWENEKLIPFAKAYSGLSDKEIREVDAFVRKNTIESFGPVRSVNPELVMELAFEGLQQSTRHKSGIATRFPRILNWRKDKKPQDANHLSELFDLLPQ